MRWSEKIVEVGTGSKLLRVLKVVVETCEGAEDILLSNTIFNNTTSKIPHVVSWGILLVVSRNGGILLVVSSFVIPQFLIMA